MLRFSAPSREVRVEALTFSPVMTATTLVIESHFPSLEMFWSADGNATTSTAHPVMREQEMAME